MQARHSEGNKKYEGLSKIEGENYIIYQIGHQSDLS
jgi:hypothetical protein